MRETEPSPARSGHGSLEERYLKLLEAAPDAILEVNPQGRIVLLNQAAERMFGYTREELLGLDVETLVPQAMRGQHNAHRASYAHRPQTRPMGSGLELEAQRKDGTLFPVEISLSPNWTEGVLNVIASVRDITERKRAADRIRAIREQFTAELSAKNEQLESRNREVEKANRLKSEFVASMSHELRTPLHTIIGFSELLSEELEGPLNEKQKRFVGHVLQDAHHLLKLINEVLDLSKIESGNLKLDPELFEFSACLEEVLAGVRQSAQNKNVHLERRNSIAVQLYADRTRVKEVLYNLLSNAVKFTESGGTVSVESGLRDDFLAITVADTGIGIGPEEQSAIFDKFYQVDVQSGRAHEGTGLGLAITRQLVELHGGKISLESEPGRGSRFTVTLPLSKTPASAPRQE